MLKLRGGRPPRLMKLYTRGRWVYLFLTLLLLLVLYPFIKESDLPNGPLILYLLNGIVILAIMYEVSYTLLEFLIALAFGLPSIVLGWFPLDPIIILCQSILHTILYTYAIFMILSVLMPQKRADIETIYGTISVYILIGLCWTNIYQIVDFFTPGSFVFSNPLIDRPFDWSDYLYYSFVTLTTLGYGDIVPIAPQARSCAVLEAIFGVIFIAVMVSKTIGLYVSGITRTIIKKE